jgi:hypothetical protein
MSSLSFERTVDGGLLVDYELGLRERLNRFLQDYFPMDLIRLTVKPDHQFVVSNKGGRGKLVIEYQASAYVSAAIINFFGLTGTSTAATKVVRVLNF